MGSILLVESEPSVHDRLATAVWGDGHEVVGALTARDAFSRTSEGGIDVIVVDAEDPTVGVELARSLRALPDSPPLVLISSSPSAPEISARIGAAAFLLRPFELAELVAIIHRHLALRPVQLFEDLADDEATDIAHDI